MTPVQFNFTEESLAVAESMRKAGGYANLGELVREALRLKRLVDSNVAEGYTQICFRNPEDPEEERIVMGYTGKKA